MLITSITTDIIGRIELLLSINQTNDDKIMTKLEKENRHQSYVFIKKTTINIGEMHDNIAYCPLTQA